MSKAKSFQHGALPCLGIIAFLAFGVSQIYAGFIGINHPLGSGWAWGVLACLIIRLPIPLVIGSYFGARDVWYWHWLGALAFAAPGLVFQFLALTGSMLSKKQD